MKYAILALLLLSGCSSGETFTKIEISPPDFIKKRLTSTCDKNTESVWMELTEHHHFKCTGGFSQGSRTCYGWYIRAKAKCQVNGVNATFEESSLSFGNSEIHEKEVK